MNKKEKRRKEKREKEREKENVIILVEKRKNIGRATITTEAQSCDTENGKQ